VHIFHLLDGANDVESNLFQGESHNRVNWSQNWTFASLQLFRDPERNTKVSHNGYPPELIFTRGAHEGSLTRGMVDFMLNTLYLTTLLERLGEGEYAVDEIAVPTLNSADALQAPGGFTHACLDKGVKVWHLTRITNWKYPGGPKCFSKLTRHGICIFGLGELAKALPHYPHLFGNKVLPEKEVRAPLCWYEDMFNRTYERRNMEGLYDIYYTELPYVRFQRYKRDVLERAKEGDEWKARLGQFNCTFDYYRCPVCGTYGL